MIGTLLGTLICCCLAILVAGLLLRNQGKGAVRSDRQQDRWQEKLLSTAREESAYWQREAMARSRKEALVVPQPVGRRVSER